jgi:hypothetical protein
MVLETLLLIAGAGTEMTPITVAELHVPGYKYLLCRALMTISHSFFFRLGFLSTTLHSLAMEDKRGAKHRCSPSAQVIPSSSETKTPPPVPSGSPPPVPSGSPPPPGSPMEISSCYPCSPVFEQGGPSGNIRVIELSSSSGEVGFFVDISRDAEFTKRLFGNLNRDLLRPPGDSKVIVLNDFDEEEEVREESAANVEAVSSTIVKSSTPAPSAADADEDPRKMQDDNSDDLVPGQDTGKSSGSGGKAISP